jgi:hypothetical protein
MQIEGAAASPIKGVSSGSREQSRWSFGVYDEKYLWPSL